MYIYVYIYIYIYVCIYTYAYMYKSYICMYYIYIYTHKYMYTYMFICLYMYMCPSPTCAFRPTAPDTPQNSLLQDARARTRTRTLSCILYLRYCIQIFFFLTQVCDRRSRKIRAAQHEVHCHIFCMQKCGRMLTWICIVCVRRGTACREVSQRGIMAAYTYALILIYIHTYCMYGSTEF